MTMRVKDKGLSIMPVANGFLRYGAVGVINTLVHAIVFFSLHSLAGMSQGASNLAAFGAAVSLSYVLNARYTFASPRSWPRYTVYVGFMGCISLAIGVLADRLNWPAAITFLVFSSISLVVGFLFSKHVVFSGRLP